MSAVLDASLLVELLTNPQRHAIRKRLPSMDSWCAPEYIDIECFSALRRMRLHDRITQETFTRAALSLPELALHRHAIAVQLPRMLQLTPNATAFDSGYLVLAELLEAPLYTCDAKLAAVPGIQCEVVVFTP